MNTDTLVRLLVFKGIPCYFWIITWMKNVNNFQITKCLLITNNKYLLRLYKGEPLYEIIGRIGTPGLCIFG